jgi:non-homologous end joining protein Ku
MPRALKNLDITLGLDVILVQLFTATRSQGVAFHLLPREVRLPATAFRPPTETLAI